MRAIPRLTLVALLASAIVCGCESGSSEGPEPISFAPAPPPAGTGFVALYAPPVDVVPYPNDLYNPTGTRLAVPVKVTSPLVAALNTLDGFSTTAVISAPFNAPLDPASLIPFNPLSMAPGAASIIVLNATAGTPLVPGLHYTVRVSTAAGSGGSLLEIVPLRPLAPRTRYVFIVTNRVRSTAGVAANADVVFGAVRDAHLAGQTSVPNTPQLTPLFPAIAPLINTAVGLGLPGNSVAVAWSMQTQSISNVLDVIDATATARPAGLISAGITTAQLGLGLPGIASIYTGFIEVPYYGDPANPLTSFWVSSALLPPNVQNPTPIPRVPNRRIPLLATLPNAGSGHTQPGSGWPVVIFQHGITLNRTVMFAMADAFAQAGFAVVAIDLPLHGVTDTASPFYQGANSPFGNNERHFNLRQRRRDGHIHARRADRQRLADPERRQPAQRARSHPPSRRRLDCAHAHAAGSAISRTAIRTPISTATASTSSAARSAASSAASSWVSTRTSRPRRCRAPPAHGPRS